MELGQAKPSETLLARVVYASADRRLMVHAGDHAHRKRQNVDEYAPGSSGNGLELVPARTMRCQDATHALDTGVLVCAQSPRRYDRGLQGDGPMKGLSVKEFIP